MSTVEAKEALKRRKVEQVFAELVEDERTREGRLLKRWCMMAQDAAEAHEQAMADGLGGADAASSAPQPMPPRSVLAFANYFSETVLGEAFEVRPEHGAALTNLTHSLIFRRVHPWVLGPHGYNRANISREDRAWRKKLRRIRRLPAETIGVPSEFLPGASDAAVGSSSGSSAGVLAEAATRPPPPPPSAEPDDPESSHPPPTPVGGTGGGGRSGASRNGTQDRRVPYWRTSVIMSRMTGCVVPHEMLYWLLAAMKVGKCRPPHTK